MTSSEERVGQVPRSPGADDEPAAKAPVAPADEPAAKAPVAPANEPAAKAPVAPTKTSVLRRFFLMSEALRDAERRAFRPGDPGWKAFELARQAREGTEILREFPDCSGAQLFMARDAAALAVRATVERGRGAVLEDDADVWSELRALAHSDALLSGIDSRCLDRAQALIRPGGDRRIVELEAGDHAEWQRDLSELTAVVLAPLVRDAEAVARVRASSALRISGALVMALVIIGGLILLVWPSSDRPNLALGRRVTVSSVYDDTRFPASSVVDGNVYELGCHTKMEKHPWLRIDLGAVMAFEEVDVYNRNDFENRIIPLLIEVSEDGRKYRKFAERNETFDVWKARAGKTTARYVRLKVLQEHTALHVNEVEVY